ncbi:MAG: LUD domain-containing protein [Thermoleophilia bacterium]
MAPEGKVEELAERLVDLFAARLAAAGGGVRSCDSGLVPETVAAAVDPTRPVVVTPDLAWLANDLHELGIAAYAGSRAAVTAFGAEGGLEDLVRLAGAGITGCIAAVASSGTIVVGPGGGNGGAIAALPPRHVAILRETDILESLAEALAVVQERFAELGGECVFVTGPSRTADIEMLSVVGVHGPVALEVIVVRAEST